MYDRRNSPQRLIDFATIDKALAKNKLLWIGTTLLLTTVGVIYAITKEDHWQASQAMVVRDEAFGEMGFGPTGRFDSNDALKRSLETILQMAKHREVVQAALKQVGPVEHASDGWPSDEVLEAFQKDISVAAPKGTEFGTSDLIDLAVRASTRSRAVALTNALYLQLEQRMKRLREEHAQSLIVELSEKASLAARDLELVTTELSRMEQTLGSDLGEMRTLTDSGSGGNLRAQVNQMKLELREAESVSETQSELLQLLREAGANASLLVAMPNRLFEAQPSLKRVKQSLVEAQLRIAELKGSMTDEHPAVRAALLNEQNIREQLKIETHNAVAELEADQLVSETIVNSLRKKLAAVQAKLDLLAGQRAAYANLEAKVEQRREQLRLANVALAEARGRHQAAQASSLITRVDGPVTNSHPLGPGRLTIVACSAASGLTLGLTLVYLVAPWQEKRQSRGRRQGDAAGRRASDQVGGVTPPAAPGLHHASVASTETSSAALHDMIDSRS